MGSRRLLPLLALSLASIAALELALVSERGRDDAPPRRTFVAQEDAFAEHAGSSEIAPFDEELVVEPEQRESLVEAPPPPAIAPTIAAVEPARPFVASGYVIDERGARVADARVRLFVPETRPPGATPSDDALPRSDFATTDERGSFRLEARAAERYAVEIEHEGFVPFRGELDGARGEIVGLVYRLDPGLSIAGSVRMPDGTPAAGARLRVARAGGARVDRVLRARCESDGTFALRGFEPGRYVVDAETAAVPELHDGETLRDARFRRFRARAGDVAAGASGLELVVRHDVALSGRVLDERGRPVTSFGVRAIPSSGFALELGGEATQREGFDDLDGRFTLDGLAPGGWKVRVRAGKTRAPVELDLDLDSDLSDVVFRLPAPEGAPDTVR